VEVPAAGNWFRDDDASGIHRSPDILEVAPASDFFDEHWCEPLGAQFLVNTEKIDFGTPEVLISYADGHGDPGDEGTELFGGFGAHTDVPLGEPTRGFKGPVEKCFRVAKPESSMVVFDVMSI